MKRLSVLAVLILIIAACGGDSEGDGDDTSVPDEPATTAPQADEPDTPDATAAPAGDADDGGDAPDVEGVGVGTATIAGETYQFGDAGQPGLQCRADAFGAAFLAALQRVDGGDGVIVLGIPLPGEEDTAGILPELEVRVGDISWMANEERAAERSIPAGSSQVDSYEVEGNTISGTATFYDDDSQFTDELVVETGTFEVTCAG